MEQDLSVKMMMLEVKVEDSLPEEYHALICKYLSLMWVVGFDAGIIQERMRVNHKKTAVMQRDIYGEEIATFESIELANRMTHISKDAIYRAINTGQKTKRGEFWNRI
jgi:hypothetical protein